MSTLVARPPSCILTHFQPSRDDGAGAAGGSLHATVELWSLPAVTAAASFPVTSTVKAGDNRSSLGGSSGAGGGRIDLLTTFGSFVACTFSDSNRLAMYSLVSHAKHNQSTMPERARCITVDASGRYLVMGSATGWLRIYTLATGSLLRQMRTHHDRGINCVSIDHESQFMVLAGEDGVISVYDFARIIQIGAAATQQQAQGLQQSALLLSISDHSLAITSLHISASKYLLSSSKDGSVRVYKLEQPMAGAASSAASSSSSHSAPAPPCLFHHSFRAQVSAAVMDVSESIIYVACKENIHWVALYPSALSGGRMGAAPTVHTWRGHQSSVVSLLLPPSSSTLLSVDSEGFLKLWDAGSPCGSAPPSQGNVIKNLGRRAGCRNLRYVDSADLGSAAGAVATANTYLSAHAPKSGGGGGGSSTGLQGKDSGWFFPPLNAGLPSPIAYVSVPLVPLAIQNQELKSIVREKSRARRFGSLYTSGSDGGADEQTLVCDAASRGSKHARADWELLTGCSGWSSLAESASNRGSTLEALQNQVESLGANVSDMYKLAVDKIWRDINSPPTATNGAAAPSSAAKAMR